MSLVSIAAQQLEWHVALRRRCKSQAAGHIDALGGSTFNDVRLYDAAVSTGYWLRRLQRADSPEGANSATHRISRPSISRVASRAVQARPQLRLADSAVSVIMSRAGRDGAPNVGTILRSEDSPRAAAKLNQIADSLTSRALSLDEANGRDTARLALATRAVNDLAFAGGRVPGYQMEYAGAFPRLSHIFRTSESAAIRGLAAMGLLGVPSRAAALQELKAVAQLDSPAAFDAVLTLTQDNAGITRWGEARTTTERQQSAAVLRELGTRPKLPNELANIQLRSWLAFHPLK